MPDWASIVREHGPVAFQTAWRILGHVQDTEDAAQDALLEALRTFQKEPVQNWGGLLRRVATHRALDRLRKRRGTAVIDDETAISRDADPSRIAEAAELSEWLRSNLSQLSQRQADVFSLRYFGELTNPEIAECLQISVETVAITLHKARANLAEKWQKINQSMRLNCEQ